MFRYGAPSAVPPAPSHVSVGTIIEGVVGSVFEGQIEMDPDTDDRVIPVVTGSAFVTAEAELLVDPDAPFAFGIPSEIS